MFIVTNRQIHESKSDLSAFGPSPNAKGPNELRLAEATPSGRSWKVRVLPDLISHSMAAEAGMPIPLDENRKALPIVASRYVAHCLWRRVNPGPRGKGKNLVFFVHGYNNDIKAVLDRARRFEETYGVEVLVFSWPAHGGGLRGVASYKSDKRDALASTGALDRCLGRFDDYLRAYHQEEVRRIEAEANRRFPDDAESWDRFFTSRVEKACPFTINLVLHSMGNYLYKHLLRSSTYRGNLLLFDNVLLVAADTNNEGHELWVERIQCRGRILITINEKDGALRASRMKMGEEQRARLGHYPYRLFAPRAVYVDFTNESYVSDSHAYFEGQPLRNAKVKRFFTEAMNGKPADEPLRYDASRNVHRL